MASVSITNIQSGMTVGTTFVAYGQFSTATSLLSKEPSASAAPAASVKVTMTIRAVAHNPTTYQQTVSGQGGYWQAGFSGLPTGIHCVLKAELLIASPPPPAEATELTVSNVVLTVTPSGGGSPAPPPPTPAPPSATKAAEPDKGKVARDEHKPQHKVKRQFNVGGIYTPGPQDIVVAYVRKNGIQRGESSCHGLNASTKTWEDTVNANAGETGTDYSIVVELQHNAKRIATCALLGVEIEN